MLKGKTAVLGVSGSIAAYKMANVASMLVKLGADVHVIMTANATNFINPITFETLTGNKCLVDTFDRNFQFNVEHVSLAHRADIFLIAPATANVIGKLACGIADDMLTTTVMASTCPKYIAPAMNTNMYNNPVNRDNMNRLSMYGYHMIDTASGRLACGDVGEGKLPPEEVLVDHILREIACEKDMAGIKVTVTAGPTCEPIDPVRYITNHSSGKMGYAVARRAMLRGADVTLISGRTSIDPPPFVNVVDVYSADDMYHAVLDAFPGSDLVIKAAAVADYTPADVADEKIKKTDGDMSIKLKRTRDILSHLGASKSDRQVICGFSMETRDLLENSKKKLDSKKADMIAANNLRDSGAGFQTDTNALTLISHDGIEKLDTMPKEQAADILLDRLMKIYREKNR